ncbi:DNA-processing protein DprA [Humisphaera borealis]|uniref:DNA-protecting protein DprA n=1 Tax=Humisphaera borealis TaxID=2807512 RepID=A0A7M2WTK6_9BACT|nr:DNA-processing protein DprA [Humisphaera borealis]QOV88857.1 DNA-protecting protein DprA [Humisphaera borealis]
MSTRHWLQLSLTRGLGPILTSRLIALAGSAEAACDAGGTLLREVDGIGKAKADSIAASLRQASGLVAAEMDKAAAAGATVISADDAAYPILLRSIPDPPLVLYMRGDFQDRDLHAVGIVGSRKCSIYGREQAERFGALLAGAGVSVISGGARGIDSAAHRGAIAQPNGRTIAVLGSGVDVAYPPENRALFDEIAKGRGAVVSEYPMGTNPAAENFPRRNRIVSGMSRGVVVIEADERSGALITARQACDEHGRPVFAVPGRVDNPLSQGPHKLIRDGAFLCARVEDVLDNLGPLPANVHAPILEQATPADAPGLFAKPQAGEDDAPTVTPLRPSPRDLPELPDRQQLIIDAIGLEDCGVDKIVERTDLPPHVVLQELTFLTLRGLVKRVDGQTYVRRNRST